MDLHLLIFATFTIMRPSIAAIMGSPPKIHPRCINGGIQKIAQDRYNCDCPINSMDHQCKLTRITMDTGRTEMQREPNSVEVNSTHSFHLGLRYITNEPTGNGVILVAKSELKREQLSVQLNAGRPQLRISLMGAAENVNFPGTIPITNDNAWHHLDIFIEKDQNQSQLVVFMLLDRCRDLVVESCLVRQTIRNGLLSFKFGSYIQLGADIDSSLKSMEGCVDKVIIQSEMLDFYDATGDQPSKQGCSNAEQGCIKQPQGVCGVYGVCQNALRATDMLTCTCRPGYRPDTSSGLTPDRWPCNSPSFAWSITSTPYNAKFLSKVPARLRLSVRTRSLLIRILVVAAWNLYLTVSNGVPKLQLRENIIELQNLNVSDGNWHLYEITITPSIMALQVDELDNEFIKVLRLEYMPITPGPADVVVGKDADAACLDDVWVDFRDTWKNTEYDYPLETPVRQSYTRYVDWPKQGLTSSCPTGAGRCTTASVCDSSATCVDEWRGYRCECPLGFEMDQEGVCHPKQCLPNPCLRGQCATANQTSNFTCLCPPGWTGELCEIEVTVASSGFDWWWILLIAVLLLLLVLLALSLLWCCPREQKQKASTETKSSLDNGRLDADSQMSDPWDSGGKGFSGPHESPFNQQGTTVSQLGGTYFSNGGPKDSSIRTLNNNLHSIPRDHGQRTTIIPPWEKFEGKENHNINLDQALEYGFEGFDGKPPPEFCADEPSSLMDDELSADWLQRKHFGRVTGYRPPVPQDNRQD